MFRYFPLWEHPYKQMFIHLKVPKLDKFGQKSYKVKVNIVKTSGAISLRRYPLSLEFETLSLSLTLPDLCYTLIETILLHYFSLKLNLWVGKKQNLKF